MQKASIKRFSFYEMLVASLIASFFAITVPNFFSVNAAENVSIAMFFTIPIIFASIAIINAKKNRITGTHGKAWFFFACLAVSQFVADQTWFVYDKILEIDPFPSMSDVFYISFFPLFIIFSIYYIAPVKNAISKKQMLGTVSLSLLVLTIVFYLTYSLDFSYFTEKPLESSVALTYTIGDSLMLIPTILAITLFLRGKVNLSWVLIFFGILTMIVTDSLFLVEEIALNYGYGHPLDIGYLYMYIFFIFGIYNNMQVFSKRKNYLLNREKFK